MGFIYSQNFIDLTTENITARSTAPSGYLKVNIMDRWHLKRRFRAGDVTTNDYLLKLNMGTPRTVSAVVLYDVNFDKVKIEGNASDSWGDPEFAGEEYTITSNKVTGRYQIYIPLTGFTYQWLRPFIPAGASPVGSYTSAWEVGAVCLLSSVTEYSLGMAPEYTQTGRQFYEDTVSERVSLAEEIRWEGSVPINTRRKSAEDELWTFNKLDDSLPFIFYENRGSDNEVYLVVRDSSIKTVEFESGIIRIPNTIDLREPYMLEQR